jgi:anhydro-N-acetylmuramic acid kinase
MGGQGAPLVPIGDQILFQEYDYCMNLGGFPMFLMKRTENALPSIFLQ